MSRTLDDLLNDQPDAAPSTVAPSDPSINPRVNNYNNLYEQHGAKFGVDPELLRRVVNAESSGNPNVTSPKGAKGLMQFIPDTAKRFGITNAYDPNQSIQGGAQYLSSLLNRYHGDVSKALAGYNSGEGNVDKYGGVPPFRETRNYVSKITHGYTGNGYYPAKQSVNQTDSSPTLDDLLRDSDQNVQNPSANKRGNVAPFIFHSTNTVQPPQPAFTDERSMRQYMVSNGIPRTYENLSRLRSTQADPSDVGEFSGQPNQQISGSFAGDAPVQPEQTDQPIDGYNTVRPRTVTPPFNERDFRQYLVSANIPRTQANLQSLRPAYQQMQMGDNSGTDKLLSLSAQQSNSTPRAQQAPQITGNDLQWHLGMSPSTFRQLPPSKQAAVIHAVSQNVQRDARLRAQGQDVPQPTANDQNALRAKFGLEPGGTGGQANRRDTSNPFSMVMGGAGSTGESILSSPSNIMRAIGTIAKTSPYPETTATLSALEGAGQGAATFLDKAAGAGDVMKYAPFGGNQIARLIPGIANQQDQAIAGARTAANKIRQGVQFSESTHAPESTAGKVGQVVARGVGNLAVELPQLIAGGEAFGAAPNLPIQGALSRTQEGIPGIIKGAAGGLLYHYGMGVTGQALGKIGNALFWTAGPALDSYRQGEDAATALGGALPMGALAGMGGSEPEPVQVEDGRVTRPATVDDLKDITSKKLQVVPPTPPDPVGRANDIADSLNQSTPQGVKVVKNGRSGGDSISAGSNSRPNGGLVPSQTDGAEHNQEALVNGQPDAPSIDSGRTVPAVPGVAPEVVISDGASQPSLPSTQELKSALRPENLLGQGGGSEVYNLNDQYVLRVPKHSNPKLDGPIEPISDAFPDANFGQPVARVGVAQILRKQEGVPAGVPFGDIRRGVTPGADQVYEQSTQRAADMPQSAYDQLMKDLKTLNDGGYQFDPSKANNLLIDSNNGRFNIVDISPRSKNYRNDASDAAITLMDNSFAYQYKGDKEPELAANRERILQKIETASQTTGLPLKQSSSYKYSLQLAGRDPTAPEVVASSRQDEEPEHYSARQPRDEGGKFTGPPEEPSKTLDDLLNEPEGESNTTPKIKGASDVRDAMQMHFNLKPDEADAVSRIADARAETWAKQTGKPKEDWYTSHIADITSGGEPGKGALYQSGSESQPFYSQLERTIDQKVGKRIKADDLRGMLDSPQSGVKGDELKWSGLDDYLNEHKGQVVTKQDIQDFLKQNNVQLQEITKGDGRDIGQIDSELDALHDEGDINTDPALGRRYDELMNERNQQFNATKFSGYQLPGGRNYREMLLTLPEPDYASSAKAKGYAAKKSDYGWQIVDKDGVGVGSGQSDTADGALADWAKTAKNVSSNTVPFQSSHFDEPNVLAHIRFNDRTIDGKRTLFLEEVQSDWHQKGRSEGYITKPSKSVFSVRDDGQNNYSVVNDKGDKIITAGTREYAQREADEYNRNGLPSHLRDGRDTNQGGTVPAAPFSKTWHELAMKRMMRYAAENGYDKIAWTTGEQQAERYDLSKQVRSIEWTPDGDDRIVTISPHGGNDIELRVGPDGKVGGVGSGRTGGDFDGKHITDVVGKEIGEQIVSNKHGELEGEGLKVGGEGMKGFYDKILPSFMNKYGKKFGAKVGEDRVQSKASGLADYAVHGAGVDGEGKQQYGVYQLKEDMEEPVKTFASPKEANDYADKLNSDYRSAPVHSLDVTPSMKQSVMAGQPLFQDNKASTEFLADNRAIIRGLQAPDVSSAAHELGHVFRRDLSGSDLAVAEKWAGVKDGEWKTSHEERFARGFERYLRTGEAPTEPLKSVFSQFKDWMTNIYKTIKGSPIEGKVSPEMRDVFDRLLGKESPNAITEGHESSRATSELPRPAERAVVPEDSGEARGRGGAAPASSDSSGPGGQVKEAKPVSQPEKTLDDLLSEKPVESPEPPSTSARKAQMAEDRKALDLPELPDAERKKWATTLSNAQDKGLSKGADSLVESLIKKPRPLDDEETAGLALRGMELKNQHSTLLDQIDKSNDPLEIARLNIEKDDVQQKFDKLSQALHSTGTESGRGLAARKLTIDEDFSQVRGMQIAKANRGEAVPKDVEAKIADLSKQIKEAQDEVERQKAEVAKRDEELAKRKPSRPTKVDYKSKLEAESQALKLQLTAKRGSLDLPKSQVAVPSGERGAIGSNIAELPGDAELLAKYAAGRLTKVKDTESLNREMVDTFGSEVEPHLSQIRQRAYAIYNDARLAEMRTADGPRKKSLLEEIRQEVKHNERDTRQAEGNVRKAKVEDPITVLKRRSAMLDKKLDDVETGNIPAKPFKPEPGEAEKAVLQEIIEKKADLREARERLKVSQQASTEAETESGKGYDDWVREQTRIQREQRTIEQMEEAEKSEPGSKRATDLRRQVNRILRNQGKDVPSVPRTEGERAESLKESIKRLDKQIEDGKNGIFKAKTPKPEQSDAIKALEVQRNDLSKQYDALANPKTPTDPLKGVKTRLANRAAELEHNLRTGQEMRKAKSKLVYDEEAQSAQIKVDRLKREWKAYLDSQKPKGIGDYLSAWQRMMMLSGYHVIGKLTSAATLRTGITGVEDVMGAALSNVPGLRDIAAKAPREGGFSTQSQIEGMKQFASKMTAQDMIDKLKNGSTSYERTAGYPGHDTEMMGIFGRIHGALKVPAARAEFYRGLEKRTRAALDNGENVTSLPARTKLISEAFADSQRAILMQDNMAVSAYRGLTSVLRNKGPAGKVTARVLDTLFPIVKVGSNYAWETGSYLPGGGLAKGTARILASNIKDAGTVKAGMSKILAGKAAEAMTPADADYVMSAFKKQGMGAGLLALGFALPTAFGGFYDPDDKPNPRGLQPGDASIWGIRVPHLLLHNPALEMLQVGATIRRVMSRYNQANKAGGMTAAAGVAGKGLAEQIPFYAELLQGMRATEGGSNLQKFAANYAKTFIEPGLMQNIAGDTDKDVNGNYVSRKTKTFGDVLKAGVPGLRETLPNREGALRAPIATNNKVANELDRLKIGPIDTSQRLKVYEDDEKQSNLSDDQKGMLAGMGNAHLQAELEKRMTRDDYAKMPDAEKAKALKDVIKSVKADSADEFKETMKQRRMLRPGAMQ